MGRKYKIIFSVLVTLVTGLAAMIILNSDNIAVLSPEGVVAQKEYQLIIFTVLVMSVIVIPVFVMTFFICVKYREGNKNKTEYSPNWDGSRLYESIWWGFPLLIIAVLSVVTWTSTHELEPSKALSSSKKSINIQVVALQWRWLFIYPDHNIATINYVRFPEKTPINFELTADAPMNSFWIPKLGGQMYAMTGMSTHLNLEASGIGSYRGSSANISGKGFANMKFVAESTARDNFESWIEETRQISEVMTIEKYSQLAKPSDDSRQAYYSLEEADLYDTISLKYRSPIPNKDSAGGTSH